jgi:hypothetical protein
MNRLVVLLVIGAMSAFLAGCVGTDSKRVECGKGKALAFKLKDNGCVRGIKDANDNAKDRSTVYVCRGDEVTWRVKNPNHANGNKNKAVAFDKPNGSPFAWSDSGLQDREIKGTVREDADFDVEFAYTVRTEGGSNNGCPYDPMIIVKPR